MLDESQSSILGRPLSITVFSDLHGLQPKPYTRTLRDLVRPIRERTAPTKARLPLLKLSSFGSIATTKGSFRHDANVTGVDGIEADYDGESLPFDEAVGRLRAANIAALLYTSPSHKPDAPRWRVLCACSRTLPPNERAALADRLNGILGGVLASESWALSQAFYFGRLDEAPDHRVEILDGRAIDLATEINGIPKPGSTPGERPAVTNAERLGLSVEEVKDILSKLPFDEWGEDRNNWVRVGMAVHHELGGDEGFEVWCEWAAQSDKFEEADSRRVWRSFGNNAAAPVRMATLKVAARATEIAGMFDELTDDDTEGRISDEHTEIRIADNETPDDTDLFGSDEKPERENNEPKANTAAGDMYAAQHFADKYKNKFLYAYSTKTWLLYGHVRWGECQKGEEIEAAKRLAKPILLAAASAAAKNPNERNKAFLAYAKKLNFEGSRLHALLGMARSVPTIACLPEQFDRDPMLLGVRNGVLDLKSGTLIPPSPTQMISKGAGAAFDPKATCPRWLEFLQRVQPQQEVRDFLQRAVGYTLTGLIDEEKIFFTFGSGANGKSVFANVVSSLMADYSVTVGSGLISKNHNETEDHRSMALLPGARLVLANETRASDCWDDRIVKVLASREQISVRKLYSEAFSFMPTHKLWIRGNHLPGALDNSDGFWRRLVPIEFGQQLAPEQQIPDLDRKIIATELPGILNWALYGALAWQQHGLKVPAEILATANRYRDDTDVLAQWLTECCDLKGDARTKVETAYQSYRIFCARQGVSAPSKPMFSRQLLQRPGLRRDPSKKHGRRIIGLVVRSDFESLDEESTEC